VPSAGRALWSITALCVAGAAAFVIARPAAHEELATPALASPPKTVFPTPVQPATPSSPSPTLVARPTLPPPTRPEPAATLAAPQPDPVDDPLARVEAHFASARAQRAVEDRQRARGQVQVTLYSTSWCGYCKQARRWLNEHGVAYVDLDVERDSSAHDRMKAINPRGGVPVIDVDGQVLHGYSAQNLEAALAAAIERRVLR
jgi:glutaredoxin